MTTEKKTTDESRHAINNHVAAILANVEYALLLLEIEKRNDDVVRALENARVAVKKLSEHLVVE